MAALTRRICCLHVDLGVESGLAAFEAPPTAYRHKRTERPALLLARLDRALTQISCPGEPVRSLHSASGP